MSVVYGTYPTPGSDDHRVFAMTRMSLEPTAPRPAPAFTADEERPITGRPFLVPLYVAHFTARSPPPHAAEGNLEALAQNELRRKPIRRSSVAFIKHSSPVLKTNQPVEKVGIGPSTITNRAPNARKMAVFGLRSGLRTGNKGVFQQAGSFLILGQLPKLAAVV
jgi:hypothetical protein